MSSIIQFMFYGFLFASEMAFNPCDFNSNKFL